MAARARQLSMKTQTIRSMSRACPRHGGERGPAIAHEESPQHGRYLTNGLGTEAVAPHDGFSSPPSDAPGLLRAVLRR